MVGNVLLSAAKRTFQKSWLSGLVIGMVAIPGGQLFLGPSAIARIPYPQSLRAEQRSLVMTCTGRFEANNMNFTVAYSSEGGFSEVSLSRNGNAIASADLSFSGRTDSDQAIWRGSTYGEAEVVLIHLSDDAAQPGDAISVSHNGQWGRGQCAGSYWYSNGA